MISDEQHRALRSLPQIDSLLMENGLRELESMTSREVLVGVARKVLDELRAKVLDPESADKLCAEVQVSDIAEIVRKRVLSTLDGSLKFAYNATGVILHTNLGRSVLPEAAISEAVKTFYGYSTLEYDQQTRGRGSRHVHVEQLLCMLTGAEAAMAVNNNAAAVLLVLAGLAGDSDNRNGCRGGDGGSSYGGGGSGQDSRGSTAGNNGIGNGNASDSGSSNSTGNSGVGIGNASDNSSSAVGHSGGSGEVIISRGELVEIGGSFRIPDIMAQSGATMVEVGTTNRTTVVDYQRALSECTKLIAKIHPSNYAISGFTREAGVEELAALAHEHGLPLYFDQGTGLLIDLEQILPADTLGTYNEPTVAQLISAGCDVVSFSGDKLLGGPQAGLIVGEREIIERLKQHPLARALRLDKMSLAALAATLRLYLQPKAAIEQIPTLAMIATQTEKLEMLAHDLAKRIGAAVGSKAQVEVIEQTSRIGGGTLPNLELKASVVAIKVFDGSVDALAAYLARDAAAPIIARVQADCLLLDVRTLIGESGVADGYDFITARIHSYFDEITSK